MNVGLFRGEQDRLLKRLDRRWAKTPGALWTALAPYDPTLREIFEANHNPAGWGGLAATPRWLARVSPKR